MKITNKKINNILTKLNNFLQNKEQAIILTLISFFSEGHLLIEDLPGIGKTTLALAISKILNLKFGRIQCTPDLLPSDIIGINIFNKEKNTFEFNKGPIFNNIILVDEINRTTQKTQSAFLEAMEERQVTVDTETYILEKPFFVIATQNPVEHYGTFPLPDSQMDRFTMNISIGYPSKTQEIEILKNGSVKEKIDKISPEFNVNELLSIINEIKKIYASDKILNYIVDIINATRTHKYILSGVSPRGSLALLSCAKTLSFFQNRNYIIPEDIKFLSPYVLSHRIICKEEYSLIEKKELIKEIINNTPAPL